MLAIACFDGPRPIDACWEVTANRSCRLEFRVLSSWRLRWDWHLCAAHRSFRKKGTVGSHGPVSYSSSSFSFCRRPSSGRPRPMHRCLRRRQPRPRPRPRPRRRPPLRHQHQLPSIRIFRRAPRWPTSEALSWNASETRRHPGSTVRCGIIRAAAGHPKRWTRHASGAGVRRMEFRPYRRAGRFRRGSAPDLGRRRGSGLRRRARRQPRYLG